MRAALAGIAAVVLLAITFPAHAAPLVLEPSSKWVADYADDSCRLVRTFGDGSQLLRLEFRLFSPGDSVWVVLSGKPLEPVTGGQIKIAYRFDPDTRDETGSTAMGAKADEKTAAVIFPASLLTAAALKQPKPSDDESSERWNANWSPEREAQIDALEVAIGAKRRMVIKLGSMKPPMDVMRNCLDNLMTSWGMDVKVQKSLTHSATPTVSPSQWLKSDDYPDSMLEGGFNDQVDFKLTVDATGKPTACGVLTMDSRPEFIKATCDALMQRAHFTPALDANGNPVPSVFIDTARFMISE